MLQCEFLSSGMARFPSLNALRTFEAAARQGSFTLAAEELCVTPGAISRQIKYLEDTLALALFERGHREVHLTDSGQAYLECLTDAFDRIEMGTQRLLQRHEDEKLNIYCSMTLTMRWLVPRLGRYHARFPTREICMHTPIPQPTHLRAGRSCVAVRMGDSDWDETINERLFDIKLVPVCSPALLERVPPLRDYADLKRLTLLHSLARPKDWAAWGAAAGADLEGHTQLQFESSSLAYEAALGAVGIAMGQLALVLDDLKSGRLVMPFPTVHSDKSWVALSARREFVRSTMYSEFRGWIREEAAKFVELQDAFCVSKALKVI